MLLVFKVNVFEKARLKLTLWYILITIFLLGLFNLAAFQAERRAFQQIERAISGKTARPNLSAFLQERIVAYETVFRERLLLFDIGVLVIASGASYFLSGRTLRPIHEMIKQQQEFAADASHELRTPLTTIGLEIEGLRRGERPTPDRYTVVLDSVIEEVQRMKTIVDGLLVLVRPDTTDEHKNWKLVELNRIAEEVFKQMESLAKGKSLAFTLDAQSQLFVVGNGEQLKQVVIIFVDNAIKYTPNGGSVRIAVNRQGNEIALAVSDTGAGIAEKDLPHIFERFYRVYDPKTTPEKGAGLGLSIAKKIIENHKGKINVASVINQGSTFTVRLPVYTPKA